MLFKRFRKWTSLIAVFFIVFSSLNGIVTAADSASSADLLDPDFIGSHGGNIVSATPDPNKSPFTVLGEAFGTDNPVEGATKTAREILGAAVERHVENVYDTALSKYVWKVEVNGNDCMTCYLHGTTYDSATGTFKGGNDDRQRIEIRPGEGNRNLIGLENDITAYNWKLKIDKDITKPDGFFHIFQYKAVNAYGTVGNKLPLHDAANYPNFSSDEDGNPILTLTISSSAVQNLEFRYADIGSEAGQETLASIPLNAVKDKWVDITVKILNSESGWVTMTMKDVQTGEILMEYNDPNRILDMWRRPEVKYNGKTFEGPYPAISDMLNRPKWGIYRKADKSNPNVKDAKIYLADMKLYKSVVGASPVNLAYGKKAYNTGAQSGNAFQLANAKAERLTDGVQTDPVKYTNLNVPQNNYSALGDLSWIGTESSKKGNVIIDLGKVMDFNQIKLFAKTLRLKYVNVSVSDATAAYSEAEVGNIAFTPVDSLYTDGGKPWTYFNAANSGGDDAADKEYLIDLGKTYTSRYVKLYFENGSGSNSSGVTGGIPTFTMTGPPRLTELEIYNAPLKPKNVTINYSSGSEATISWDPVPADRFIIYDNGKALDEAASNIHKLTNLDPGAVYNLSVKTAYTDPYSFKPMLSAESEVEVLRTDGDPIIPNPPPSVTAAAVSEKSINVSWEAAPEAQSYRVALVSDANERIVADDVKSTSYTIRDLSPGVSYKVKVYAIRRGTVSTAAAEGRADTPGIKNASDNLLFNKEVQYSRVWNDDLNSYGAHKALDNDAADGSRWVALKGSSSAWMMVDIGETTPVNAVEYYSFQNKLKKVSFYYATDGEAFTNPNSDKWVKIVTDDRVAQGKYGNPGITKIAERITLAAPVNARFIKFTVDEVDGDINVNEIKAFGPISFVGNSALRAGDKTSTGIELNWSGSSTNIPVSSYEIYNGTTKIATVAASVYKYNAADLKPGTEYTFRVRGVSEPLNGSVFTTFGGLTLKAATLADTQPPTTTDDAPKEWVNRDTKVSFQAIDTESVVAATYFTVDGGAQQTGNTVTLSTEGTHTLAYWSVDAAGNVEQPHTVTVRIDKTTPVTEASTTPAQPEGLNGWYVHPVTVSLNVYDHLSGVTSTEYSLDGGSKWMSYSGALTIDQDGLYGLAYRSKDGAGNAEVEKKTNLKLDFTGPEITVTGFVYGTYSDASEILPTVAVNDRLSGADEGKTLVLLDGKPYQPGETIQLYTLPLGAHSFTVKASDLAGNAKSETVIFQTAASLKGLEQLVNHFAAKQWIRNAGITNSLLKKLEHGDLQSFINEVQAQSGKQINGEAAGCLLRDARALLQ
ncbi:OmpL47-type beta-barrel domain-containing protein [Paenibacillus allorhizosphaerae]|uniref:Carbohydrate-binding protein n=1 Tax=Paenibacillus allorhizosphaerae TaxID=2849866 RepID=A0ABM8VGR2_9BACL|nr:fibronectin type III domain-containing protein [Paenibacillus allorhizosphaerae]CAG7639440.1 hypothetical protein PAECIP111802_02544 [Paenibacillus allorhizosphaerae]